MSKKVLSFGMKHTYATASTLEFEILRYTLKIFSSNHIKPFNIFFSRFQSAGRTECVCDEQEGFVFWMKHKNATASTLNLKFCAIH